MITRQRFLVCTLTAAMVFAAFAFAGTDPNKPCPKDPNACGKGLKGPGDWMKDKLGLTDEQATQLEQLRTAHMEQMKATFELRQEKRKALDDAVESGADEATIRAAAAELGKVIGDASVLRAKHFAEIKTVLTEEQQNQMKQLKEDHKERWGKMGPGKWDKGQCPMQKECPMKDDGPRRGQRGEGMGPRGEGRMGRMQPPSPEKFFDMKDTDSDGKLTLEEYTAGGRPTAEQFKNADTDGDGFLTVGEFEDSMKKFMQEQRRIN